MTISEFADTILANEEYLEENMGVLEKDSLQAFLTRIKKFKELLEVLNTKSEKAGDFQWDLFMKLGIKMLACL